MDLRLGFFALLGLLQAISLSPFASTLIFSFLLSLLWTFYNWHYVLYWSSFPQIQRMQFVFYPCACVFDFLFILCLVVEKIKIEMKELMWVCLKISETSQNAKRTFRVLSLTLWRKHDFLLITAWFLFLPWLRLCLLYWLETDLEVRARALVTWFGWIANLCGSCFAALSNFIFGRSGQFVYKTSFVIQCQHNRVILSLYM